jgi:hypothetical protein
MLETLLLSPQARCRAAWGLYRRGQSEYLEVLRDALREGGPVAYQAVEVLVESCCPIAMQLLLQASNPVPQLLECHEIAGPWREALRMAALDYPLERRQLVKLLHTYLEEAQFSGPQEALAGELVALLGGI